MGLAGEQVVIVGARRLQNQLIASHVEAETGLACRVASRVDVLMEAGRSSLARMLVLWDAPRQDGERFLAGLREIRAKLTAAHLLALFNVEPQAKIEPLAFRCGVRGFFYQHDGWETLAKGIRSLFAGEVWMPRAALVACLLEQQAGQRGEFAPSHDLTPREVDVLRLLAVGASNGSIAERLCISPHTARTHVHRIFKKIGTSNRLEAALWAAEYL